MWHDIRLMNALSSTLFVLAVASLLAAGLWWVAQRPMFTLKVIEVEGLAEQPLRHVNALTVRGTAVPQIRGNFFTANLQAVRGAFESVPWVRKAAVRREWPNRLIVAIEEHQPLGTWGDEGRLVSAKGDVFTANLAEAEDDVELLELSGPAGSEKDVVNRLVDLRTWFAPVGLTPVAVRLSSRYAWSVRLSNGMQVELGREETRTTLQERVARLVALYPQLAERLPDRIERVDLRYQNGLALKATGLTLDSEGKKK